MQARQEMHSVVSEIYTAASRVCSSSLVPVGNWKVQNFVTITI